jgi:hypothetical protein
MSDRISKQHPTRDFVADAAYVTASSFQQFRLLVIPPRTRGVLGGICEEIIKTVAVAAPGADAEFDAVICCRLCT